MNYGDTHINCRREISHLRRRLKSAYHRSAISETHEFNEENNTKGELQNKWNDQDDLELALDQLDDDKIQSMSPRFWKEMVIRVQYVIETNRLLRADIAHLRNEHHCPLYTCKYSNGCCAQIYYSTPPIPANHEECDRRCQDLEEEIEALKKERSRLRQQNSSIHNLIRKQSVGTQAFSHMCSRLCSPGG